MSSRAGSQDAEEFLNSFRPIVKVFGLVFVPRRKNMAALNEAGLSIRDAEEIVLALTADDCRAGPEADHDGSPGEVWTFSREVQGVTFYIKLKLQGEEAKCLSFHPAQTPADPADPAI